MSEKNLWRSSLSHLMKHSLRTILAVLWVVVQFSSCAEHWDKNVPATKAPFRSSVDNVSLELVKIERGRLAVIRLSNRSPQTIHWTGEAQCPWYKLSKRHIMKWHEIDVGWFCGTGLGTRTLLPNQSFEFYVRLWPYGKGQFQAGLSCWTSKDKGYEIWSPPFEGQ